MKYLLIVAVLLLMALPSFGAPSFLGGFSGNIVTPDGAILPEGGWQISYHQFNNFLVLDEDLSAFGLAYGLAPNLEVGASFISNDESDAAFNGKFGILPETAQRPAIVVGVVDAAGTVEDLDDDPALYLLLSKNVTPIASEIAGEPSRPLRLSVGFGTGYLDGLFAGLDWTLAPQFSLMAEFTSADIAGEENAINIGARYAATSQLRLDAALIDFDDLALGASFTSGF